MRTLVPGSACVCVESELRSRGVRRVGVGVASVGVACGPDSPPPRRVPERPVGRPARGWQEGEGLALASREGEALRGWRVWRVGGASEGQWVGPGGRRLGR